MFILNPEKVQFGTAAWLNVLSVAVDVETVSPVEEWGDTGPWCQFVDSAKRRVTVTVRQEAHAAGDGTPSVGEMAELKWYVSPSGASRGRQRVRATCVVTNVKHEHRVGSAMARVIELRAVSNGSVDPVVRESAEV